MSKAKDLARLQQLAQLMLDHRLVSLKQAADAKQKSEGAIRDLRQPTLSGEGLAGVSGALAGLAYDRWADALRASLNQTLARQTHDWLEARDAARGAFGKADALRGLAEKHRG